MKAAETVGRDSRGYDSRGYDSRGYDSRGYDSRGYDEAKKINGRKRHLVVDTKGLPLFVLVTPADMTDREACRPWSPGPDTSRKVAE